MDSKEKALVEISMRVSDIETWRAQDGGLTTNAQDSLGTAHLLLRAIEQNDKSLMDSYDPWDNRINPTEQDMWDLYANWATGGEKC